MALDLDIPEPKFSRFFRAFVLVVVAIGLIAQWENQIPHPPDSVLWLVRLAALIVVIGQQNRFQTDRDRDLARIAWTVFGRTVLSLRRTRLCALREVVITRRVESSSRHSSSHEYYPVHLVGDFKFKVFTIHSDVEPARSLAAQIAHALNVPVNDRSDR